MKSDIGQAGRFKILRIGQRDPAFNRSALLAKETSLVGNAKEAF
jgi:hypothetical protein